MEELLNVLSAIKDGIDFEKETGLIENGLLSSLDAMMIIAAINENFGIEIPATEILPQNFDSAEAMWNMIQRIR